MVGIRDQINNSACMFTSGCFGGTCVDYYNVRVIRGPIQTNSNTYPAGEPSTFRVSRKRSTARFHESSEK